jgi:hypothetical protein
MRQLRQLLIALAALLNGLFQVTYGPQGYPTDIHTVSSTGSLSEDKRVIEMLWETKDQAGIHLLWVMEENQ